jgi:hypothetical protein
MRIHHIWRIIYHCYLSFAFTTTIKSNPNSNRIPAVCLQFHTRFVWEHEPTQHSFIIFRLLRVTCPCALPPVLSAPSPRSHRLESQRSAQRRHRAQFAADCALAAALPPLLPNQERFRRQRERERAKDGASESKTRQRDEMDRLAEQQQRRERGEYSMNEFDERDEEDEEDSTDDGDDDDNDAHASSSSSPAPVLRHDMLYAMQKRRRAKQALLKAEWDAARERAEGCTFAPMRFGGRASHGSRREYTGMG